MTLFFLFVGFAFWSLNFLPEFNLLTVSFQLVFSSSKGIKRVICFSSSHLHLLIKAHTILFFDRLTFLLDSDNVFVASPT